MVTVEWRVAALNNQKSILYQSERVSNTVLAAATLVAAAMLGWLLFRCNYGFDFTDESYYLIWISNPWIYDLSASQFGFIYHPLYRLCGGDIVLLRQGNILITFVLGWLLCATFFRETVDTPWRILSRHNLPFLAMAAVMAGGTLVLFSAIFGWLPTPNYNGLTLQAMLLAGTGILLAEKSVSRSSVIGWVLIGMAGWLAFMAKPTTAAALGLVIGVYLLVAGKCKLRLLAIAMSTAAALLIASAWVIDGSIVAFIERLKGGGLEICRQLDAGHSLYQSLRIDGFTLGKNDKLMIAIGAIATWICVHFAYTSKRSLVILGLSPLIALLLIVLDFYPNGPLPAMRIYDYQEQGMLIWAVPLGILAAALTSMRGVPRSRPRWALALCFFVFPHVYAFGHGGNYWHLGSGAGIFWVLASLVVLTPAVEHRGDWSVLLPTAVNVQLIAVFLLYVGMDDPYRQPQPLRLNTQSTIVGDAGSHLILSHGFAGYIDSIASLARKAGFKPGTPMIDLSGHTPGALYCFGARSIGQPWMIGGYKGSERLAVFMLDRVSCDDIAQAWLLVEPSGPRKLNPAILQEYGLTFPRDYVQVGDLATPSDARGYNEVYTQLVFKPARPLQEAAETCRDQKARP